MRLLNRLFVSLFVRRKAQAHARAVLDDKVSKRARASAKAPADAKVADLSSQPQATSGADTAATPAPEAAGAVTAMAAETVAAEIVAAETVPVQTGPTVAEAPVLPGLPVEPGSPREVLIRTALAARKAREPEWDALTPAQKSRAIAGLGESMAALVETYKTPDRAA